ncbi:MAG: signal peptidase I [Candidatus Eutrophobiaceae bacterium]
MNIDFALILFILVVFSGLVYLLDILLFAPRRKRAATEGKEPKPPSLWIDYCRSLFPVFLVVFLLRSFLYEPYRIPSGSMIPTLLVGDFILVNKYVYGFRLPVLNKKILSNEDPERGDVIVFRYPLDPSVLYIKRVIGMPEDKIFYYNKQLLINGELMPQEILPAHEHKLPSTLKNDSIVSREFLSNSEHDILIQSLRSWGDDSVFEFNVPKGHYFVLGDNRDGSRDSRVWGYVPESHLVGKAVAIWMNFDWDNWAADFSRIGKEIH